MSYESFYDQGAPTDGRDYGSSIPDPNSLYRFYSLNPASNPLPRQESYYTDASFALSPFDYPDAQSPFMSPDPNSPHPYASEHPSMYTVEPAGPVESPFNPLDHTRLDPSHFDPKLFPTSFAPPRFSLTNTLQGSEHAQITQSSLKGFDGLGTSSSSNVPRWPGDMAQASPVIQHVPSLPTSSAARRTVSFHGSQPQRPSFSRRADTIYAKAPAAVEATQVNPSPIYDLYGSSVASVAPAASTLKLQSHIVPPNHSSPYVAEAYDPASLGVPAPPTNVDKNWSGLYSSSGIDMLGILGRVANRRNPEIQMGAVDMGCSFLVVDARQVDMPIVYASETFSRLTGYTNEEIMGRNCRFLQSPDGIVEAGSKRKYTDNNAVHHLRQHIVSGKETQASLINYHKGGKPFINLITVIPITWDSDEIAFFVGFQVDLVDQPAAILEKMKNGTYVVNYTLCNSIARNPSAPSVDTALETVVVDDDAAMMVDIKEKGAIQKVLEPGELDSPGDILDIIAKSGVKGLKTESSQKYFNRLLLENCDDFVHVVSLKGTFLYVSRSAAKLLQYEPSELIGKTLASVCHPSDIVAVLRELKESGSSDHPTVNLLYRIRRKHHGYMWLESSGKLHVEHGKGRKCVILSGRPQTVHKVSWADLERAGGLGEKEYWSKYSMDGMHLYTTPSVQGVLGYTSEELMGSNISKIDVDGTLLAGLRSLDKRAKDADTSVTHKLRNKDGASIDVVTNFYPDRPSDETGAPSEGAHDPLNPTIIAQTNLLSSELAKHAEAHGAALNRSVSHSGSGSGSGSASASGTGGQTGGQTGSSLSPAGSPIALALPTASNSRGSDDGQSSGSSGGSPFNSSFSAMPSTFKTLSSSSSDNIFDELDKTRGTSWQFELHQLRLINRKLREEKEALAALQRKRRKRSHGEISGGPKAHIPGQPRTCANCGRSGSPEWRSGPTGPKTLCNACGLRWSKARSQLASGTPPAKSPGASGALSPGVKSERPTPKNSISVSSMRYSPLSMPPTTYDSASASSFSPETPRDMAPSAYAGIPPRPGMKTTESSMNMSFPLLTLPPPDTGQPHTLA